MLINKMGGKTMIIKIIYLLFVLTMTWVVLYSMGRFLLYPISWLMSFACAAYYYHLSVERKPERRGLSMVSINVGFSAGLLGLIISSFLYDVFDGYGDENHLMFTILGIVFFGGLGVLVAFCVPLFKKSNIEKEKKIDEAKISKAIIITVQIVAVLFSLTILKVLAEIEGLWSEYFYSFLISFISAQECYRVFVEHKSFGSLPSMVSVSAGLFAGLLGLIIFGLYDSFFSYYHNEDTVILFLLGTVFYGFMAAFVCFCVSLFKENEKIDKVEDKTITIKMFTFLFFLTMVGVAIGVAKIGTENTWRGYSAYFFAFVIPFCVAYFSSVQRIEYKPYFDLRNVFSVKVGLLAGLLGLIIFGLYDTFLAYHKDEDLAISSQGLFFFGYIFFMYIGFFAYLCAYFLRRIIYNVEKERESVN